MSRCPICEKKGTRFFVTIKDYTYCHCNRCKTLFLNPQPLHKKTEHYYRDDFIYDEGIANESVIRKRAKVILGHLFQLNPYGRTLLDIGCGYGFFLHEAKKNNLQVSGIEPSTELFSYPLIRKVGNVENDNFEHYFETNPRRKFDFITLTHVVEHTARPQYWLKAISTLLNPGGILYIETPNLDSHLFYAEKYFYTFLTPPNHIFLFSKKSFFRMIRYIRNLQILRVKTFSYPEHFMGIIKKIFKKGVGVEIEGFPTARSSTPSNFERALAGRKSRQDPQQISIVKKLKYLFFDKVIAVLFYRFLNIHDKGSILELYVKKI